MISSLKVTGKFLDQPILVAKLGKAVPIGLGVGAGLFTAHSAFHERNPKRKKKTAVQTGVVLASTIASALVAPKIATAITKKKPLTPLKQIIADNTKNVDEFVSLACNFNGAGVSNLYGIGNIAGRYMLEKDINGILANQTENGYFGFCYLNNLYQDVLPFFINFFEQILFHFNDIIWSISFKNNLI